MDIKKDIERAQRGEPVDFGLGFEQPLLDLDQTFVRKEALPRTGSIRLPKPVIQLQQHGTCGAFSVASAMSSLVARESGKKIAFDGMDIYTRASVELDGGIFPYSALDIIRDHGAAALNVEGLWRIDGYGFIDPHDHAAMKSALRNGMPLTIAAWLDDNFYNQSNGKVPVTPGDDETATSYHAMCIYDFDADGNYLCANSWGEWWSDGGVTKLTPAWMERRATHVWAVTDKADWKGGFVKGWDRGNVSGYQPRLVHRPGKPAIYAVIGNGLMWVPSMTDAGYHGYDIMQRRAVPLDDEVWLYPVYGKTPPPNAA